jgi:hypothetical protein
MSHAFDTLAYARQLQKSGLNPEHAMGIAEATREHVMSDLATKSDMLLVKADMLVLRADMKSDMEKLELRMVIKLGGLIIVAMGFLAVVLKLPALPL